MIRAHAKDTIKARNQQLLVSGWVNSRRDHGGIIFIDLRDHTGVVQLTIRPENKEAFETGQQLRDEFVISAKGKIVDREKGLINPNLETGEIELVVEELIILNKSKALPIQVNTSQNISEENRLKYRYLDLRRPKMQRMLKKRAELYQKLRSFMDSNEFTEISTPVLANSSPEGARDFLVPSRIHPGKFYALPQAPQQFKQLLMVGGVSRYYQIAACFRDEDPRADRLYGEFYQLDMEMSFVSDGQEIRDLMDQLIKDLVTSFAGKEILSGDIVTLTHKEAIERFGSDKPDMRYGMELIELTDVFSDTEFGVFKRAEAVKAICVKNGATMSRSKIDEFTEVAKKEGAGGLAYLTYQNGEIKSPITKFFSEEELEEVSNRTGAEDGDIVFFGADTRIIVNKVLGRLRTVFADYFELKNPDIVSLVWVIDFPFYEWDEAKQKVDFGHNPFSMPKGGLNTLKKAKTDEEKLSLVADQFDMAMNGYEICSGAIRNHNPEVMYEVFGLLGYSEDYVNERFGAMINAFKYGAPPHGGCAFGIDRMFMELLNENNIREVIAFPKNGSGVDLMMSSPSVVDDFQLKELNVQTINTDD